MALSGFARMVAVAALPALLSVGSVRADESGPRPPPPPASEVSPALIGLEPGATPAQAAPSHRKLWIALGVVSGVAVIGGIIAVGVSVGMPSHSAQAFNDWGTLTVTKR